MVNIIFQRCFLCKRCSMSSSCEYLNSHIRLKFIELSVNHIEWNFIELSIKLYQEFWKNYFVTSNCKSLKDILKAKSQCKFCFFLNSFCSSVSRPKVLKSILPYSINFQQKVTEHFQMDWLYKNCLLKKIYFKLKIHRHKTFVCYLFVTCLATV